MVASRSRPKGARVGPFGLSVLALSLAPTQIGYQDLAALLVRQQDVSQRARAHALASPFGTIHAATFSFPRPVGTLIPEPPTYQLASLNAGETDITGSIAADAFAGAASRVLEFPVVNRRLKGDLLVPRSELQPQPPTGTRDLVPGRIKTVSFPRPPQNPHLVEDPPVPDEPEVDVTPIELQDSAAPSDIEPMPTKQQRPDPDAESDSEPSVAAVPQRYSIASLPRGSVALAPVRAMPGAPLNAAASPPRYSVASLPPISATLVPAVAPKDIEVDKKSEAFDPIDDTNPVVRLGRLYFGSLPVGRNIGPIERWPGDEPILMAPAADPDMKRGAMAAAPAKSQNEPLSSAVKETIAPKGQLTGADQRPKSPAERLGLSVKERAKAEKCLAEAVYFESRGETKRGQIAVAQVVMNRVFSGYYPATVCGVVYQNAHRYNACQFTFACDRIKDVVTEPDMWEQAKQIARDTLDGRIWLTDIGKSTHYHAYWVHPWWVGTMRKLSRIGVHTFYRPRRWGDGADAPVWGAGITPNNVKL